MDLELEGKIAVITGNSHGIGKAVSEILRKEGVIVPEISRITGYDLMNDGIDKLFKEYPKFDILVNCVGGMGRCELKDWKDCMQKNYGIMHEVTNRFIASKKHWGRVITIASIYGKEAGGRPWFVSAKAAEIAYMKSMAHSNNYPGITFNTVSPGHIDTGKLDRKYEICGQPDDVANIVTFLCSDKAKHINGANIVVDGGESYSF